VRLRAQVVNLIGLRLLHKAHQVAGVAQVAVVQLEIGIFNMRVLVDMVDPLGIECAGAALDTVYHVVFFQQEFRQVGPVLAGDTGDQCDFGGGAGASLRHVAFEEAMVHQHGSGDSRSPRPCTILNDP
jgi:hypothetical protein